MKKLLLKKHFSFIIPIVFGMMFFSSANAQIIYTDLIPDTTVTCSIYAPVSGTNSSFGSIDLNNDGVSDLTLELGVSRSPSGKVKSGFVKASPLNGAAIKTDTSGNPLYMNLNDVVDSSGSWMTTANQILYSESKANTNPTIKSGNWITATDGFLGLKINSGSHYYYCWVRLNVAVVLGNANPVTASVTIKDYAYNSIPNQPILAGQTVATGIAPLYLGEGLGLRLFPNPASNQLTIGKGQLQIRSVKIIDLTGREFYTENQHTSNANSEITIDVSKFPAGVYAVQIQTTDFIVTKKLVIEK